MLGTKQTRFRGRQGETQLVSGLFDGQTRGATKGLIAFQVARTARDEGFGHSLDDAALQAAIEDFCWMPDYPEHDHSAPHPAPTVEAQATA